MTDDVVVRRVAAGDHDAWVPLWRAYLAFYRAELPDQVYDHTWSALLDAAGPVHGLVAEVGGRVVGLAHVVLHASTWDTSPSCYLEDLYVDRTHRGGDVARALIEGVYRLADREGAATVYWLTQEYNGAARSLYDTVATKTSFVHYQRP